MKHQTFLNLLSGLRYSLMRVDRSPRETEIGGPGGAFPSTLWTLVLRAKDPAAPDRREALQKLIETYWKPLYNFVRRKGKDVEASKDIIQGFFTELLAKDQLRCVDRDRGKFRTFLLTALERDMADAYDRAKALKRGGGQPLLSLDFTGAEEEFRQKGATAETPDHLYKRDWAVHVMAQALDALRGSFESSGRSAEFETFKPYLTSTRPAGDSYKEMARTLSISVEDVRNRVSSFRDRYRKSILEVIRASTESEQDATEELRELRAAFS
jgi:RNA polymerase sigma-70 factor (ECF subfamily)